MLTLLERFRHGFMFEAAMDTGAAVDTSDSGDAGDTGDAGGEGGDAAAADDGAEAQDTGTQATETVSWQDSPEFYEAVQTASQAQVEQYLQQLAAQQDQGQGQEELELDPYSEEFGTNLMSTLTQAMSQMLDERLGPITEQHQQQVMGEAEQRALDIIQDVASREQIELSEPEQQAARALSDALIGTAVQRLGPGPRAAEYALNQAVKQVAAISKSAGERAVEQYKNQLGNIGGAQGDLAAGTQGVGILSPPKDEAEAFARFTGIPGLRI